MTSTRLGAKKGNTIRPLRVELKDEYNILWNAKKNLARSEAPKMQKIYIKKDMTYKERKEDQELRRELKEKREKSNEKQDGARWIIRRGRVVNTARPEPPPNPGTYASQPDQNPPPKSRDMHQHCPRTRCRYKPNQ